MNKVAMSSWTEERAERWTANEAVGARKAAAEADAHQSLMTRIAEQRARRLSKAAKDKLGG